MEKNESIAPTFKVPVRVEVRKYPANEVYMIQSVDNDSVFSEEDYQTITKICSQELIYDRLFKELFNGEPYTMDKAKGFVSRARDGWQNNDKFVFLIRNDKGKIVAAMDIKSDNTEEAEIGYWASKDEPGIMTNSVVALCQIAKEAGYKSLYGLTVPDNEKSQKVLARSGFEKAGEVKERNKTYIKFTKIL